MCPLKLIEMKGTLRQIPLLHLIFWDSHRGLWERGQASPWWCLHLLGGCRGKKTPRRLHKHLLVQEPQRSTSQVCMLLSPGVAGVDRQQLVTIVHREEGQREMPEQFPGWDPRGAGTGALEADSGTGVRDQSAGGRVTSPAWVQMALHMALLLPELCLLRQHLRSRQALAETLKTSLSPHSCLDLEGQWVSKRQAALPQAGGATWWPSRRQCLPAFALAWATCLLQEK